jgi:RNA polymerase sigma factor (sigma-70 family)
MDAAYLDNQSLLLEYHQNRDIRLRNVLVEQNLGLVHMVAHKMINYCTLPFEELVQIGSGGLIKAVERFEPAKKRKFSSLAVPFIQGAILQWLRDKGRLVKVPRNLQETHQKIKRYSQQEGIPYIQAASLLDIAPKLAEEASTACTQYLLELPQALAANTVDEQFDWEPLLAKLPQQHATIIRSIYIEAIPLREIVRSHSLKSSEIKKIESLAIHQLKAIVAGRVKCPSCGKYETIKNGRRTGKQSYLCKSCGHQFVENPAPVGRRGYDLETRSKVLSHIAQGKSLHWCETYYQVDHSTIYLWAKSYGIKGRKVSRKVMMTPVQQQWQLIGKFNGLAEWLAKNCPQSPQLDSALQSLSEAMQRSQEAVVAENAVVSLGEQLSKRVEAKK